MSEREGGMVVAYAGIWWTNRRKVRRDLRPRREELTRLLRQLEA